MYRAIYDVLKQCPLLYIQIHIENSSSKIAPHPGAFPPPTPMVTGFRRFFDVSLWEKK